MKRKALTIHDIAKKLNIAASTVSRALNNNPNISRTTIEKVNAYAIEGGYRPNLIASNLRKRKTNSIGIVVPQINRNFFSSFISGVEKIAFKRNYNVIISQSNNMLEKEKKIVYSLFSNQVDGLIVSLSMQTNEFSHFKLFQENNIPLVFFDRVTTSLNTDRIIVDDFEAGYRATKHLIDQGYKRIAHIAGPTVLEIYSLRRDGYIKALKDNNLPVKKEYILTSHLLREDGENSMKQFLELKIPPDAIFCGNDTSALGLMMYLKKIGIKIPENIGIVGFSDEPFSELITPTLSTLRQPAFEMGEKAAELLIERIEKNENPSDFKTIVMPTKLIVRESSSRKK